MKLAPKLQLDTYLYDLPLVHHLNFTTIAKKELPDLASAQARRHARPGQLSETLSVNRLSSEGLGVV